MTKADTTPALPLFIVRGQSVDGPCYAMSRDLHPLWGMAREDACPMTYKEAAAVVAARVARNATEPDSMIGRLIIRPAVGADVLANGAYVLARRELARGGFAVLAFIADNPATPFATWQGHDRETYWGHYFAPAELADATADFESRGGPSAPAPAAQPCQQQQASARPVEYVDLTPTWRETLTMLLALIENGDAKGRLTAVEELARMATLADVASIIMGAHRRPDAPAIPEADALLARFAKRIPSVEEALDWAYRQGYSAARRAADDYTAANGSAFVLADLGTYGDKLEFYDSPEEARAKMGRFDRLPE